MPKQSLWILKLFTFLGAFLLFSLEPLTGKLLLPSYGGSFHVWTTCLMLFQGLLVFGYFYCHGLAPKIGRGHLIFACLPLLLLPIHLYGEADVHSPILSLSFTVLISVGLPFLVLASTSVMAQSWLARSDLAESTDPYQLYSASNIGSLLALIAYPVLMEPFLSLSTQKWVWSGGYGLYLVLLFMASRVVTKDSILDEIVGTPVAGASTDLKNKEPEQSENKASDENKDDANKDKEIVEQQPLIQGPPTLRNMFYWFNLAAWPSALLMSVTNVLTIDVGSLPMLWVVPLALYTLTFILIFRPKRKESTLALRLLPEIIVAGIAINYGTTIRMGFEGPVYLLVLFALAYACHAEMYRNRPSNKYLTRFYLVMSIGGWAGGIFVSLIAPRIFTHLNEYPVTVAAIALLLFTGRINEVKEAIFKQTLVRYILSTLVFVIFGYLAISTAYENNSATNWIYMHRNYYGIHRIKQEEKFGQTNDTMRTFYHGTTIHGRQVIEEGGGKRPISYYHSNSPLGKYLTALPKRPYKIAVVGLGAGTLAAYCRKGDELTFYEIDPDNERIAREHFDFLSQSEGKVDVVAGDARLSLTKVEDDVYDLIIVDAFSSDAIPVHLLTLEAMTLYKK
ncbi:MAG: fused MFS/spermidine synthase, partial [Planctomycetota bacterium]|nr:fused MFS/spermidine synthase [Planctomycetota bacterium]